MSQPVVVYVVTSAIWLVPSRVASKDDCLEGAAVHLEKWLAYFIVFALAESTPAEEWAIVLAHVLKEDISPAACDKSDTSVLKACVQARTRTRK